MLKRQVVAKDTIDAMPTSKNWSTIGVMTVGVSSNQNDVGGSAGEHQNQLKAHGGSFNDRLVQLDGIMNANMACNYSCTGLSTNDASTQELSYEFGAISAEVAGGGVRVNIIPKDGGNRFSGSGFFNFANDKLQGGNVDDALRTQGIVTADSILKIYDVSGAFGGPIKKDKLWFWTAHRYWGYQQIRTNTFYESNQSTFVFTPDLSRPGHRNAAQRERRHPPDLADEPEEQAVGLLQHRAAQDGALDAGQHAAARRVEPAEPAEEQLRNRDVPLDAVLEAAVRGGDGQHHRDLDARAGRGFGDVARLSGDRAEHRHQLPRLPGEFLEQLHVAAVVSQLADLRHRVARVQVGHDAAGRARRHRRLDQQGHVPHRAQRAAVPGDRSAPRRTRRTNGWSRISACTRRTPGRSSG